MDGKSQRKFGGGPVVERSQGEVGARVGIELPTWVLLMATPRICAPLTDRLSAGRAFETVGRMSASPREVTCMTSPPTAGHTTMRSRENTWTLQAIASVCATRF